MEEGEQLVLQRVRNRIMEYLELASSFERQRSYQAHAPVFVPSEVINQWEDWVDGPSMAAFVPPVFMPDEVAAMSSFHVVWETVANDTPVPLPDLERLVSLPSWMRLRDAAQAALQVFERRGRMPEDCES